MAAYSFDIVSKLDFQELANAVDQAKREIENRFDFKGSKSELNLSKEDLILISDDEGKLKQVKDVLESKVIKRGVSLKALEYAKIEAALGGLVRQKVTFVQGISKEEAKKINKQIKETKLKVSSQIMEDKIRVSGKSRDDLQKVINLLKDSDISIPLQFKNYQ